MGGVALIDGGVPKADADNIVRSAREIMSRLNGRGFSSGTRMLAVFAKAPQKSLFGGVPACVRGIYFELPEEMNGHPCFQKVLRRGETRLGIVPLGIYIFWSCARDAWKISS